MNLRDQLQDQQQISNFNENDPNQVGVQNNQLISEDEKERRFSKEYII